MTLLPILLAAVYLVTGNSCFKSFTGAFSSNSGLDVCQLLAKSVRAQLRYFGMKLLWLESFDGYSMWSVMADDSMK